MPDNGTLTKKKPRTIDMHSKSCLTFWGHIKFMLSVFYDNQNIIQTLIKSNRSRQTIQLLEVKILFDIIGNVFEIKYAII